jgi:putative transcriptional regulator
LCLEEPLVALTGVSRARPLPRGGDSSVARGSGGQGGGSVRRGPRRGRAAVHGRRQGGRLPRVGAASDLSTPLLLIAMPQVVDPFFHKSVVLLVHHDEEGSLGLIVNRATELPVREILEGMEVPWLGPEGVMTHFGGPVQPQLGTVLFDGGAAAGIEAANEVAPGVMITQHVGDLGRLAEGPPERFRLLLGYAGWGEGQLLDEILRNDWLTAPVAADLVFAAGEAAWAGALHSVGVDPASLPSWTPATPDGGESAN